jgi:hypothetical protein
MTLNMTSAPVLAATLIELRDETLKSISDMTDIRVANLSVWLRGKEQVISERRIVSLLDYLGLVGGTLAQDRVHSWRLHSNIEQLTNLLGHLLTQEEQKKSVICCDGSTEFPQVKFLGIWKEIGWTWVRLQIEAGLASVPNVGASSIGFGKEYILPSNLKSLPFESLALLQEPLLRAIKSLRNDRDVQDRDEMKALQNVIEQALKRGVSINALTENIKTTFLS